MDENSQHLSNSTPETADVGRRPGRPAGIPKPPGSGRKKGTPNKVTADIKALALKRAPAMLKELERLATEGKDERTRLAAVIEWLNRAVGRPMTPSEVTGKDGAPLVPAREMTAVESARAIVFALSNAARDNLPRHSPMPQTYDGLKRAATGEPWSPDEPAEVEARAARYPEYRQVAEPTDSPLPQPVRQPSLSSEERYALQEELMRPDQREYRETPNVVRMRR